MNFSGLKSKVRGGGTRGLVGVMREVDLGEFEFAGLRDDIDPDDRLERDTREEERLFKSLVQWVEDAIQPNNYDLELLIAAMKDPKYSAFFSEPRVNKVYRGIGLSSNQFAKIMGDLSEEALQVSSGSAKGDWVLNPRSDSKFSSFSRLFSTAKRFALDTSDVDYSVVFSARIVDNPGVFFDFYEASKKLLYDFNVDINIEAEAIGLGPVKIHEITWAKNGEKLEKKLEPGEAPEKSRDASRESRANWEEYDVEYGKNEY